MPFHTLLLLCKYTPTSFRLGALHLGGEGSFYAWFGGEKPTPIVWVDVWTHASIDSWQLPGQLAAAFLATESDYPKSPKAELEISLPIPRIFLGKTIFNQWKNW